MPGAETVLIQGAGHSPDVEKPAETAALLLGFAGTSESRRRGVKAGMQDACKNSVQNREAVREPPRLRTHVRLEDDIHQTELADAVDLVIDFATLGEYGLEPADAGAPALRGPAARRVDPRGRALERGTKSLRDAARVAEPAAQVAPERRKAAPNGRPESEEPAATYSPRRLPPKYHRRRVA